MPTSQQVQLHEIYRFLAQAMRYPEEEWFNGVFLSLYDSLLHDLDWPDKARFAGTLSDHDLEARQVEYTRLFITGVPQVVAPPYASVYMDDTIDGPTTARTRRFYLDHGYDLADRDFPDHIVNELDFAALLEEERAGGSEKFLAALFRPWFAQFKKMSWREARITIIARQSDLSISLPARRLTFDCRIAR